eukprot:Amastigsp_a180365_14.p5 type:complete len:126 gc:universal Amastigsp_a180365_14:738-361(-)
MREACSRHSFEATRHPTQLPRCRRPDPGLGQAESARAGTEKRRRRVRTPAQSLRPRSRSHRSRGPGPDRRKSYHKWKRSGTRAPLRAPTAQPHVRSGGAAARPRYRCDQRRRDPLRESRSQDRHA